MEIKYPILILALLAFAYGSQDVTIPSKQYGFTVGDPYGTLQIQFFLDFQCPDSKDSYEAWYNVRRTLSLQQNKVKLTFQFNPLPYHFYSVILHEAFFYVLKQAGATAAENYMTYVFGKLQHFSEQQNWDKTGRQFIQDFSREIAPLYGLNPADLQKELAIGSESFKSLKDHWRYTTIVNGVPGTPIFYANGVRVDGAQDYSYLDWINFIKKYKTVQKKNLKQIEEIN